MFSQRDIKNGKGNHIEDYLFKGVLIRVMMSKEGATMTVERAESLVMIVTSNFGDSLH